MHIFLVGAEMLLCMPMEIMIEGPNLKPQLVYATLKEITSHRDQVN